MTDLTEPSDADLSALPDIVRDYIWGLERERAELETALADLLAWWGDDGRFTTAPGHKDDRDFTDDLRAAQAVLKEVL